MTDQQEPNTLDEQEPNTEFAQEPNTEFAQEPNTRQDPTAEDELQEPNTK